MTRGKTKVFEHFSAIKMTCNICGDTIILEHHKERVLIDITKKVPNFCCFTQAEELMKDRDKKKRSLL